MIGALSCTALFVAFYLFSFGATRLLLRKTVWDEYSLDAPWLTGPALVILSLSLLGYHEPFDLPAWQPWCLFVAGSLFSVIVVIAERKTLADLLRANWKRSV